MVTETRIDPEIGEEPEFTLLKEPPPEVPPEPPPEPPPTVPEVKIPKGAELVEKTAQNKPAVYKANGERYYAPDSTMYKMGFRTHSEYIKAQGASATHGIHEGTIVPEDSIIITTKDGKPLYRYTPTQIKTKLGADYINPYIEEKQYKIPVLDYKGKEVLLTPAQADRLAKAEGIKQFKIYQELGIVSKKAKYLTAQELKKAKKEVALSKFERQQYLKRTTKLPDGQRILTVDLNNIKRDSPEVHRLLTTRGFAAADKYITKQRVAYEKNRLAISMLEKHTDKEGGVDGAKYLRDNPKDTTTLKNAGFEKATIEEWQGYNSKLFESIKFMEKDVKRSLRKAEVLEDAKVLAGFTKKGKLPFTKETIPLSKLTLEQKAQVALLYTNLTPSPIRAAEIIIPGVYVARNWATLSVKDRAINIGIDVAAVLLGVGIFKLAGATARTLAFANKQIRVTATLATTAGKAGKALDEANKAFMAAQKISRPGSSLWIKHANKVEKLRQASMKADRTFLTTLENLDAVSPKQLKLLEQRSGLTGVSKAINDIIKAQRKVSKAWKQLDDLPLFVGKRLTDRQLLANNRHLVALAKLQKAQAELQAALGRAGSVLKPRYTPSPPAAEFKGYGMAWQPGKPKPAIKPETQTTIDSIESWLAKSREVKPTGKEYWQVQRQTAVATAEKVKVAEKAVHRLKLKAVYKPVKPKPTPKPKVPKVEASAFPGVVAKPKVALAAIPAIGIEAVGRMTAAQIAKYYGTEEAESVTSRRIKEALKALAIPGPAIKVISRAGIEAYVEAYRKGLPASAIEAKVSAAIEAAAKPYLAPLALTATKTKVIVKVATKVVMKPIAPIKPVKPIKPVVPLLRIPPSPKDDKAKRKLIREAKGAISFRMGELQKKDVWYTYIDPYQKPQDKIIVVGKAPVGATIVRGPGSAIKTAQLLYGKTIARRMMDDVGFMDAVFEPTADRKGIRLSFHPDPKGLTTGDFGISKSVTLDKEGKRVFPLKKE